MLGRTPREHRGQPLPSAVSPRVRAWLQNGTGKYEPSSPLDDVRALRTDQRNIGGDLRRALLKLLAEELGGDSTERPPRNDKAADTT